MSSDHVSDEERAVGQRAIQDAVDEMQAEAAQEQQAIIDAGVAVVGILPSLVQLPEPVAARAVRALQALLFPPPPSVLERYVDALPQVIPLIVEAYKTMTPQDRPGLIMEPIQRNPDADRRAAYRQVFVHIAMQPETDLTCALKDALIAVVDDETERQVMTRIWDNLAARRSVGDAAL